MKLDPIVDSFMKANAPKWHYNLTHDKDHNDLQFKDRCVVGEVYGWKNNYDTHPADKCRKCIFYGNKIWEYAWDYYDVLEVLGYKTLGEKMKAWKESVALPAHEGHVNRTLNKFFKHIKEKHPELLKQEKQIEA